MTKNQQIYRTRDLAEAAALVIQKQEIIDIERQENICWFVFNNKEECQKIANQFLFNELLVNAKGYHEVIVRLKHRIFSQV